MDVIKNPGRALSRDIAKGEAAEAGLNAFIEQRHRQRVWDEGERLEEAAFMETTRREEARRRAEENRGRLEWHRHLVGVHAGRMKYHARIVDALAGRRQPDKGRNAS